MSWKEVDFESLFAVSSRNGVYKSKEHHGAGVRIVNMGEMFGLDRIGNQPMSLIRMSDSEMEKSGLIDGDLLFGRRSLVEEGAGKCSLVMNAGGPLTFESSIIRVRLDRTVADPEFYFNYFRSPIGRSRIRAIVSGVTVKGIRGSDLKVVKVHLPPVAEQVGIRMVVATYDDLIATNQRRIQLLEDAARLLYREWFVHLRFPAYELVDLKDGVPDKWQAVSLGALCDEVRYIVDPKTIDPSTPYLSMEHMPQKSITLNNWDSAERVGSTKLCFRANDVLFGKIRPYFHKVGLAAVDGITSTDVIVVRVTNPIVLPLVLMTMSSDNFVNHAVATSNGTKMPRANWKVLRQWPVLLPNDLVLEQFCAAIALLLNQMSTLMFQIRSLTDARNLLLPKLMSGQLNVSGIPLPQDAAA